MNKFVTVWMVYATNPNRTEGKSDACLDESSARILVSRWWTEKGWSAHYVKQQYEIDNDGHYECGDDE